MSALLDSKWKVERDTCLGPIISLYIIYISKKIIIVRKIHPSEFKFKGFFLLD
jgi:hypothetical protein